LRFEIRPSLASGTQVDIGIDLPTAGENALKCGAASGAVRTACFPQAKPPAVA
jgi:hypothetical protein